MRVRSSGLSSAHPVTANLNEIFFVEAGALEINNPLQSFFLVATTEDAAFLPG